jgi:hypothetical protein
MIRIIRLILIRCNQIHNTIAGPFLKIDHQLLHIFGRAFARYNTDYQSVLGVISYMVPIVSLLLVGLLIIITVFFFLSHKGPFLIELNFSGLWGKTLPTHHARIWRAFRPSGYTASPCRDAPRQGGRSCAHHNLQKYGLTQRPFFPLATAVQAMVCLFARKIVSCMLGSIATGYGYFCRTRHIQTDCLHRVFHNLDIFYSGNRILKELALSYLQMLTAYEATICPLFWISARQHKSIQY